ncbi:hypothetical protein ES703_122188 [subsurface metagenome]
MLNNLSRKTGIAENVPRYNNVPAEQRLFHKPVQLRVTICSSADYHYRGRFSFFLLTLFAYPAKRSFCNPLTGQGSISNYRGRHLFGHTVFD